MFNLLLVILTLIKYETKYEISRDWLMPESILFYLPVFLSSNQSADIYLRHTFHQIRLLCSLWLWFNQSRVTSQPIVRLARLTGPPCLTNWKIIWKTAFKWKTPHIRRTLDNNLDSDGKSEKSNHQSQNFHLWVCSPRNDVAGGIWNQNKSFLFCSFSPVTKSESLQVKNHPIVLWSLSMVLFTGYF